MIDILNVNKIAWDHEVENKRDSTIPVSSEKISKARMGEILLTITQSRIVPKEWLGDVRGKDILVLAGGGGQQGPLLAAAGAHVTVLDISKKQLGQDRHVMDQYHLVMTLIEGSMTDLSMFGSSVFDIVINPVSNCYIPDVNPVWQESFRVLRPGGSLLVGFDNPVVQIMDWDMHAKGVLQMRYKLPYADTEQLEKEKLNQLIENGKSVQFGHVLEDQIGGQIRVGFVIAGLYEDYWGDPGKRPMDKHLPSFIATRAVKPV